MAVVVDASAIGAIAFDEPEGPTLARYLRNETLLAPLLLDFELTSLALKKARKRPELLPRIVLCLEAALALPISRMAVPGLAVLSLAAETGLTAYDTSYLWLARSRDMELVTLDTALQHVVSR
jgi:predicted nucleic acid-binding protein